VALEAGIVVGGVTHPVTGADGRTMMVVSWRGPTPNVPEFKAGDGYNKPRVKPIDCCVWHWTGGEAEPPRVAETLRRRKLGVEFAIGRDGRLYQFCDPLLVDTADAGILNSRSVGVEIVCYGFAGGWTWDPVRALKVPRIPPKGRDRETYLATTHGRSVRTAKFYPAQVAAALALADALSSALPIPRDVPPSTQVTSMPTAALVGPQAFRGHLGHYHVSEHKRDPGPWFMDQLRAKFIADRVAEMTRTAPRGVA